MLKWRIASGESIDGYVGTEKTYLVTRVNNKWVAFSVKDLNAGFLCDPQLTFLEAMRKVEEKHGSV
jgi:hypothetical protein